MWNLKLCFLPESTFHGWIKPIRKVCTNRYSFFFPCLALLLSFQHPGLCYSQTQPHQYVWLMWLITVDTLICGKHQARKDNKSCFHLPLWTLQCVSSAFFYGRRVCIFHPRNKKRKIEFRVKIWALHWTKLHVCLLWFQDRQHRVMQTRYANIRSELK